MDEFVISSHPSHSEKFIHFSIFDRWGNQVFQSQETNASLEIRWDGKNRGKECASGVYVYILQTTNSYGEQKNTYGNIALLR